MKAALQGQPTRYWMHGRLWLNDPDTVIVGATRNQLTLDQIRLCVTFFALAGGSFFLSDDVLGMDAARIALVRPCLPSYGVAARPVDLFEATVATLYVLPVAAPWGRWYVVGVLNWEAAPATRELPLRRLGLDALQRYHGFDFWRQEYLGPVGGGEDAALRLEVPATGVRLLALRPLAEPAWSRPELVGSDFHVTQGAVELASLEERSDGGDRHELTVRLVVPAPAQQWQGTLTFLVPPGWQLAGLEALAGATVESAPPMAAAAAGTPPGALLQTVQVAWTKTATVHCRWERRRSHQ